MLFLLFQLGADRYALDAGRVVEVLPLVGLNPLPGTPPGVAGMFSYRGDPVPVVDLSRIILGRPHGERLTTRIILIHYTDGGGNERRLGLIAENVVQVMRREENDFQESGLRLGHAPYLGPMLLDEQGVVQWVQEDRLLPNDVRDAVFAESPISGPA